MEKGSRIKAKPDIPWSGYAERENNSSDPHTGNGNNPDLHGPHGDQEQREDEQSLDSPVATAPFPLHCFPPVLQSMARAISESTLVPDNLSGACVLGILSAALGKGIHVQSSPNRLTRGNLYIAPSALSGTGKSEAFRHAAAPFQSIEEERIEAWTRFEYPSLLAGKQILDIEIKHLQEQISKNTKANNSIHHRRPETGPHQQAFRPRKSRNKHQRPFSHCRRHNRRGPRQQTLSQQRDAI
jgi:uncharacterized protein DUF3987